MRAIARNCDWAACLHVVINQESITVYVCECMYVCVSVPGTREVHACIRGYTGCKDVHACTNQSITFLLGNVCNDVGVLYKSRSGTQISPCSGMSLKREEKDNWSTPPYCAGSHARRGSFQPVRTHTNSSSSALGTSTCDHWFVMKRSCRI